MQTKHKLQSRKGTSLSQNILQKNINNHVLDICFHKSIPFFSVAVPGVQIVEGLEQAIFFGSSARNNRNLELFIRPGDLTLQIQLVQHDDIYA